MNEPKHNQQTYTCPCQIWSAIDKAGNVIETGWYGKCLWAAVESGNEIQIVYVGEENH